VGLIALLLAGCAPTSDLHDPDRGFEPPAGVREEAHVQVRMRDGARLDTHLFLPGGGEAPVPTILVRSPYRFELDSSNLFFERLLGEGYAVVLQHERGRYLSEGEFSMLAGARDDGLDTIDWIVAQEWSDGTVGTFGCSSSAENQLKLGAANHPAHRAMIALSAGVGVAEAGPFREQGNFWRGGAWQQGWFDYFVEQMQTHWPRLPPGLSDDERRRTSRAFAIDNVVAKKEDAVYESVRMHLPMIEMAREGGAPTTDFETYLKRGPSHPAWSEHRVTEEDEIYVPTLWAEGLYDISARSATAFFEHTRRLNELRGRRVQFLTLTNGRHCGFGDERRRERIGDRPIGDPRFDYGSLWLDWFDHWLKGVDNGVTERRAVHAYLAGADEWREFDEVPAPGVDALALYLDSDGRLADDPPAKPATDNFTYDPADPVISHGGEIFGVGEDQKDGSFDQREIERRDDVLVYTSSPLTEDLAVFGFVRVVLHVASDRPDTDFTVKLVDVYPDGRAFNISDTILRMRYRSGTDREVLMEVGSTYEIELPPMLVANAFKRGHRIRVEVSSSNFPTYARNLNTSGDPYTTTEIAVAQNEVFHGPATPSRILLPVVESDSAR
jgi:putative CocE/NonD family hydrolase